MLPGIYLVQFGSNTGGLAVLDGRRIHGGDLGFFYRGIYQENAGKAKAKIEIIRHNRQVQSPIFGAIEKVTLSLEGTSQPTSFTVSGTAAELPQRRITITGAKHLDLAL